MEPTLALDSVVLVTDDIDSAENGDVVLVDGSDLPIVHRLVHCSKIGNESLVYHRGDSGGGIGVASGAALQARVVAIMEPERRPVPRLTDLHADLQRGFRRARVRCRLHSLSRSFAFRLGLERVSWIRRLGRSLSSKLLGLCRD